MSLIGAQILVAKLLDLEGVAVLGQESEQLANFCVIGADRVRAAVGFELKPSQVFIRSGLQGEWHVEAAHMIIDGRWGLSAL